MRPTATLTLVDTITDDAVRLGNAGRGSPLRAQAARVRAMADELGRHHPAQRRMVPLHAQLGEEIVRLAALLSATTDGEATVGALEPIDVLVVDDDLATLGAMAAAVRDLGYPTRTAPDGEAAAVQGSASPPAIVVSDWDLPGGMSGLELCRTLKQRDPHAYVVLVTAFPDEALKLEGVRHGVDDFLPKPVDLDELAQRLQAAERLVRAVRLLSLLAQPVQERAGLAPSEAVAERIADSRSSSAASSSSGA